MIGKICLQVPTKYLMHRAQTLSSGCHVADICWDRDALRHRQLLKRSHMILTLRFQSSAGNNTQDTLSSLASPRIAVTEFSQLHLTFPGNKLLVREQGHSDEVGQEENVLLCLTPVSLSPTGLPTQPLLQQQPGAPLPP